MPVFTIYDTASGEVVRVVEVSTLEHLEANVDEGCDFKLGNYQSEEFYFADHEPVQKDPKPGPWALFDPETKAWFDPRTPVQLAEDLNRARANTWKDKSDLLIALAMAGILSEEEADEAAGGVIPASMQSMVAQLPPEAQMAARIKWKADNLISRNHPVIVAAAYAMGVTDEQLDRIFDVPTA